MAPQLFSFSHLIIPYKMSSAKTEQLFISAVQSSPVQQQQQQQQQQQSASQQSSPSQRGGAVRESTAASATQSAAPEPPRVVGVTLVQQQQEQRPLPPRIVGATLLERSSEPAPCRVVGATLVQQPSSTVSAQEPFSAVNLKEIVLVENNKKETNRIVNELINISSSSDSNNKIISIDDKLKLKTNTTSSNDSYDDENNKLNSVHISNTQEAESINNSVSNSNRAVSSVQGALVEAPDNKASGCRLRGGGGGSTSSSSSPPPAAASGSIKTTPSPAAKVVSSAATPTTALVQANNKSASGGSASAATNNATMAAVVAVQRTNTKPCCFCWCCCCTCSCLAVKSGDELNSKNKEANYLESLSCDGEPPPTLEDIRSWGHSFDKLMKSAAGRKVFRDFLKCEYSEENILFWLACEELKRESNPEVVEEKARFIYEDYISILSPKEVSLDSRVREIVNKNMVDPTPHTFDEAQLQIYTLMHRDSYPRFINSHIFKRLAQLNNNSVVAPPACSTAAAGSSSSPQGGSSSHQQPSSSRKQSIA